MKSFTPFVLLAILPSFAVSMGTATSIFGILRNRWIFAGAVNEQQLERFERRHGGMALLKSFPDVSSSEEHKVGIKKNSVNL
jgi:hypothetical protein